MSVLRRAVWPIVLLASAAAGQDRATSLAALADRSASVVTARCASRSEDRAARTAGFELLQTLAGRDPGPRFVLREPPDVLCGSALHGVGAGHSYVVFLDAEGGLLGGARGIEPLSGGLAEHVELLVAARAAEPRLRLLATALSSPHARVRGDAALELRYHRSLDRGADRPVRELLLAGLRRDPLLAEPATAHVLAALQRIGEERAIEPMLDLFVGGRRRELDRLVKTALAGFGDDAVAARVAARGVAAPAGRLRQVELLEGLAAGAAGRALARLAVDPDEGVRARALRAVLARNDTPPAEAPPGEVAAARAALDRDAGARPRFRSIRPPDGR